MRLRNIPEAKEIVNNSKYVLSYPLDAAASLFVQNKPMSLEIGMGKGKFIIEMAKLHPEKFFIGVERYESVLLRAVQKMEKLEEAGEAPENLRFICEDASVLPEIFGPDSVDDIYLNFSDPWPKSRHADRRLTS